MKTTKHYAVIIESPISGVFNFGETVEVCWFSDKTWQIKRMESKKRIQLKPAALQLCHKAYDYSASPKPWLVNPKYV